MKTQHDIYPHSIIQNKFFVIKFHISLEIPYRTSRLPDTILASRVNFTSFAFSKLPKSELPNKQKREKNENVAK